MTVRNRILLQQVLRCCMEILLAQQGGAGFREHMGWVQGELDWAAELQRLVKGGEPVMEGETLKPNERQVGGEHYRKNPAYQHWDFVAEHGLGYFEGQITKYLTRWRTKNGVQDVAKAQHYCDKLITLFENNTYSMDRRYAKVYATRHPFLSQRGQRFIDEQGLSKTEEIIFELCVSYSCLADLYRMREHIKEVLHQAQGEAIAQAAR